MVQTIFQPATPPTTKNYPKKLQSLILRLQNIQTLTPAQVKAILLETDISAQELMPWSDFSHPVEDSYGRQLVFDGGHFEIMVMSWLPGDFSAIHDHGSTEWGAVQCFGKADHFIYRLVEGVLTGPEAAPYLPGMVRTVDNDLIHQMGNTGNQPFLSLHVYGCAGARGNITGNARIFDLYENSIQHTDGGVFFCLPDSLINDRRRGLSGTLEATLLHHQQMGDRLQRILQKQQNDRLQQQLWRLQAIVRQLSALA